MIVIQSEIKPPLPPKSNDSVPVPPPRRKKTGMTPLPTRKEMVFLHNLFTFSELIIFYIFLKKISAPPSPSLRERVTSLKRMIVPNKATPETSNNKEGKI